MANELYIEVTPQDEKIAFLQDKRLNEFYQEKKGKNIVVGDIFVGTVRKILPGNNAAFVNIGLDKDAFVHYSDLGPNIKSFSKFSRTGLQGGLTGNGLQKFQFEPETLKTGNVSEVLKRNQQILVQILILLDNVNSLPLIFYHLQLFPNHRHIVLVNPFLKQPQ